MGNKVINSETKVTQLSNFNTQNVDIYQQLQQLKNCCGIQYIKLVKKKLIWQNSFITNCQLIKHEYKWASQLLEVVKFTKLSSAKYLAEINIIKRYTQSLSIPQNQILMSPSQVEQFRQNLKQSVLLSFGQAKQQLNEPNKITSTINTNILGRTTHRRKTRYDEDFRMSTVKTQRSNSISNRKSVCKSGLRNSIMSFVDDTLSSVFGGPDKQISKQNAKAVENFLNFTMIVQKHMTDQKNILSCVQKTFINYIKKLFSDPKVASRDIQVLTNNIKQYLILMRQALFDHYNIQSFTDQDLHGLITNQENVLTVLTSILFKDKDFYQVIFNAIVEFNVENEDLLSKILGKLEGSPPQFFQVKQQYCLNQNTLRSSFQKMSLQSTQNKIDNLDLSQLRISTLQTPYRQCLQTLRQMERSKTPNGKMKIIMSCSQKITKCISRFYQSNQLKYNHWVLDADQILSIFCYILANSKIPHLHTHLFILQNFSSDHQLISVTGYYYSVITCALEQIQKNYQELIA